MEKGAGVVARTKPEDLPSALSGVVGDKAASDVMKVVQGMHPKGSAVAGALRGATSQMAVTVNQTSLRVSEFLRSFGPKASVLLSRSGEALACKFSGDCSSSDDAV